MKWAATRHTISLVEENFLCFGIHEALSINLQMLLAQLDANGNSDNGFCTTDKTHSCDRIVMKNYPTRTCPILYLISLAH